MNEEIGQSIEEIEGILDEEDASWGDYPIDTLLIRNENRTVHDVLRRIEKGSFILNPDFQRDFIWPDDKQSKLIESMLMRIPLPVFYLAEDSQGRMIVVDGLQRLSTFQRFVNNGLKLKLPDQPELHGKFFGELSPKLQNRIEDCNLILYIIDAKVPERARLDIFERVNGGVPLTRQQMRNCLYMGPSTSFLKDEASSDLFRRATGNSLRTQTMRDREFVNRFCAFRVLGVDAYKGDMDDFLAQSLSNMNTWNPSRFDELSADFRRSLANNYHVFTKHAFRKHIPGQTARSVLNASLWDVMSVGLSDHNENVVTKNKFALKAGFFALMDDEEFIRSITYSVNHTRQVEYRFDASRRMFREIFDD